MKKSRCFIILLFLCVFIVGCATKTVTNHNTKSSQTEKEETTTAQKKQVLEHPNGWIPGSKKILSRVEEAEIKKAAEEKQKEDAKKAELEAAQKAAKEAAKKAVEQTKTVTANSTGIIVIDAGHQGKGNSSLEPIGPGATTMKPKVAAGTTGISTKIPEYQLTLTVAKKLKSALTAQGYQVLMIRESHDVNISNKERAEFANKANADVFIRIHANGSNDTSIHGVLTACQTEQNPYCSSQYPSSYRLSQSVVNHMATTTGAKNRGVWKTDIMSGINWCTVPSTIVEMGFMSNPDEDQKMSNNDYQDKMVQGMVNGINEYMNQR